VVAKAAVAVAQQSGKPVVAISNLSGGLHPRLRRIFDKGGIPLLQGTREGLHAVSHVVRYAKFQQEGLPTAADTGERKGAAYLDRGVGILMEYESKKVLGEYGIPCAREVLCHTGEEVLTAAKEIGYPLALKALSPRIPHKTEAGVIRLNLKNEESLLCAYEKVMANASRFDPDAKDVGFLVQEMIQDAVAEAIVGISRDPSFGPVVVFGLGGTMVELFKDRTLCIPPLTRAEAEKMIPRTRASRLLQGFRGRPLGDTAALVDVLVRVGQLAIQWEDRIQALDINPLLVLPAGQGVVAVDALVELR